MLIPSATGGVFEGYASLSRRVNANSQLVDDIANLLGKLIKKGEC